MAKLLNSFYLGASTPSDYGNFVGGVELLPFDYYLGSAVPSKQTYIDVILSGVSPLTLTQAIADGLNYLKLFGGTEQVPETYLDTVTLSGGTEQNGTPTPDNPINIVCNNGVIKVDSQGQIYTDGTQEVVTDSSGNTASAERLLAFENYKDTQEVIAGAVTRNVGIKVLDGTEDWYESSLTAVIRGATEDWGVVAGVGGFCTHLDVLQSGESTFAGSCRFASDFNVYYYKDAFGVSSISGFKQFLADQYANGTPVIIVYPISSATTETVSAQPLSKSPVTQTAGSINNLPVATTESSHTTPSPQQPLDINCNNGVLKVSPNLLQGSWFLNQSRTSADGTLYNLDGAVASDIFPVQSNTTYTVCYNGVANVARMYEYDANKSYITGSFASDSSIKTTSSNTKYISVSFTNAQLLNVVTQEKYKLCSVNKGNVATPYMPYGQIYTDGTVETVKVSGINLFDKTNALQDGIIWSNALGNKTTLANYYGVNPIPVVGGQSYTRSGEHGAVNYFLMKDGTSYTMQDSSATITVPNNAIMWYFNNKTSTDKDTAMVVKGNSLPATYEPYFNGGSATAEMLLAVSSYKDQQEVLDGGVTRNVGVLVLDGTEEWNQTITGKFYNSVSGIPSGVSDTDTLKCSHFKQGLRNAPQEFEISFRLNSNGFILNWDANATIAQFKQWLADQYNAGTPVIIVYPLATATTETVTAQTLTLQHGTNIVEITQASMSGLTMEVGYKAGVSVTVTEIEDAQLSNDVIVNIGD